MKKIFIIANWKSNKTIDEAEKWLHGLAQKLRLNRPDLKNKEIILCPSFTLFEHVRYCSENLKLPIKFGAQDISPFDEGAYTGEIYGRQIKEFADYVLIGHSERKTNFHEDNAMIIKKVAMARKYGIASVFFIQNETTPIPKDMSLVVYEPPSSISPGIPDTPENAQNVAKFIKEKDSNASVLYGGSVTSENIAGFTKMPSIDGVVVGRASLNPEEFADIVKNA